MRRTVVGGALIGALLVGLFFVLRPGAPGAPAPKVFDLEVRGGHLVSGTAVLTAAEGDLVTIRITADVDDELHLHGYDLKVDLVKGVPASLSFTAALTGRFVYELEHSGIEIGALEVHPR